jgi:hypothetical protein
MMDRKQNTATYPIPFLMVDSNDHMTGKTGLVPTVTLSKNGGSFNPASALVSELGNGWYALAGNAADTNTLGELAIHISATGADPVDLLVSIKGFDPVSDIGSILTDVLANAALTAGNGSVLYIPNRATDPLGNPLDGVDTLVTTSLTDPTIGRQARATTNPFGLIDPGFMLDPGTYAVWRQRGGDAFDNPEIITVVAP